MSAQGSEFNTNGLSVQDFDCGDGIPALTFSSGDSGTGSVTPAAGGLTPAAEPKISIRVFALAAGVLTQILIGIIVALGGNAVVGVVAAITVLTCSLILVLAEATDKT
ncbi:MAG: hypothetical protein AAGA65_08235 [Actinomycetota bacterium]